jgi:hypothetical protein
MQNNTSQKTGALSALLLVVGAVALPADAHAYLDPGTGSMVIQVIVAGLLGAAFTFKSYMRAIFGPLLGLFRKTSTPSDS